MLTTYFKAMESSLYIRCVFLLLNLLCNLAADES